jgi:hypothetical protein
MMFFPKTIAKIQNCCVSPGQLPLTVDMTYDALEDELIKMTEEEFDREFEAVFVKMLRIGTSNLGPTIQNRPKGANCPV